ncbi:MAG: orotidine-5'-phosphate decarboxylase, partial [Roseibacillus sp.]|nr:orotidine-5'-phosphate decarboxylase [Roseibacillus sp.]
GLGAQGGDLSMLTGAERQAPNVVNVSRGVLYGEAGSPRECATRYAEEIAGALQQGE